MKTKVKGISVGNYHEIADFSHPRLGIRSTKINGITFAAITAHGIQCVEDGAIEFKPILITKEWVIKLGWKHYTKKRSGDLTRDFGGKLDVDFVDGKIQVKSHYEGFAFYRPLTHIKYVHQLQNLYFLLCGEELKIKFSKK
jgi:hypothetical protein